MAYLFDVRPWEWELLTREQTERFVAAIDELRAGKPE